ncbi:MAG: NYN domain-containing protein [Coriobacteriia bacterium]|nr:NYN domain-containing protein [Coriobacteriia bacterium]
MSKLLLIDGYNVIHIASRYREAAERDIDTARELLINDVASYAMGEWDAVCVFDGAGNPHSCGSEERVAGITVIFSAYGESADSVIEKVARSARSRGQDVEVVTSDAETQWAVMGSSIIRRSSPEFAAELEAAEAAWKERAGMQGRAARVEDRISPGVRKRLERLLENDQRQRG